MYGSMFRDFNNHSTGTWNSNQMIDESVVLFSADTGVYSVFLYVFASEKTCL